MKLPREIQLLLLDDEYGISQEAAVKMWDYFDQDLMDLSEGTEGRVYLPGNWREL